MAGGLRIASGGLSETGIGSNVELLSRSSTMSIRGSENFIGASPWSLKEVYGNGDVGCDGVGGRRYPVRHPGAAARYPAPPLGGGGSSSDTAGQQHGGPPASGISMVGGTRGGGSNMDGVLSIVSGR